jgi:hypothetical protein
MGCLHCLCNTLWDADIAFNVSSTCSWLLCHYIVYQFIILLLILKILIILSVISGRFFVSIFNSFHLPDLILGSILLMWLTNSSRFLQLLPAARRMSVLVRNLHWFDVFYYYRLSEKFSTFQLLSASISSVPISLKLPSGCWILHTIDNSWKLWNICCKLLSEFSERLRIYFRFADVWCWVILVCDVFDSVLH